MDELALWSVIKEFSEGVEADGFNIIAGKPKGGRFKEEINLELFADRGGRKDPLLVAKIFTGRGPYRDWVEIFGINPKPLGMEFFGSKAERVVLDRLGNLTGRIFVEYFDDCRTAEELKKGVPPALSRLGFELAKRGFSMVRDWYIPEGLMEGGHKLQGEKTDQLEVLKKRLNALERELSAFISGANDNALKDRVLERFKILVDLWKDSSGIRSG